MGIFRFGMLNKGSLLSIILWLLPWVGMAQSPVLQGNPSSVKWNQINTPSFKVIFPRGFEQAASKIANDLERLNEQETASLSPSLPRKIPIVLHMYQSISNGLVGMGPWRSEFNLMPSARPELQGVNPWDELLSTHEYRHMVQFHHSRQGFNRLVYYVLGQQGQAAMAFAAVPRWFWEGDATLMETLHTESGRGRIPAFGRVYRTNFMEGKRYGYNKQHLGSYKDFIPDHYRMGYYFVSHIRRRTNNKNIWEDVTRDAFRKSFIPFTFSNALKKHTGIHLVENYELMMDDLENEYSEQLAMAEYSDPEEINIRKETTYTDYKYPQELPNGSVVALKSGIGDVSQFVTITSRGLESTVLIPGIVNDVGMLSVRNQTLLFTEIYFDPRWRNRTYSVLKTYDFSSGKTTTITERSRYQGGDISPDEQKIVTSESDSEQHNRLVVLEARSGRVLNELKNPDNGFYTAPRWTDDGKFIVAVKQVGRSKSIVLFDYRLNSEAVVYLANNENVSHAVLRDSVIYYNSPISGIDNIYAITLSDRVRYRVTQSKYGAYNPEISNDGQWLYYNEHRLNGMDVVKIPLKQQWEAVGTWVDQQVAYYEPLLGQEGGVVLADSSAGRSFPVKKYRKAGHMFNVHSWGPLATTDLNTIDVGIASRDVINTTRLTGGYRYDLSENTGLVYGELSYQGLYPILDLGVEYGHRNSNRGTFDDGRVVEFDWDELTVYGGVRLPFLLTRSKMLSEFIISNQVGLTQVKNFENPLWDPRFVDPEYSDRSVPLMRSDTDSLAIFFNDELSDGLLISNNLSFTYYRLLKRSPRDINSRYGFIVNGRWLSTPFGGDFTAETIAARITVYLPSPLQWTKAPMFKHHSLFFTGAWQTANTSNTPDLYNFRNQIPRPRGYSYSAYPDFLYGGINYTLPLWYPDIALGPIVYFKRFRANAFYDYGQGKEQFYFYDYINDEAYTSGVFNDTFQSVGVELTADVNLMRFPQEFGVGFRYSRLLTTDPALASNKNSFDLILNIDF